MLSVPDEIKNILHEDTCFKNIRIHFPNGERSDICNDQIVMDSVSFTESLCSQDTLKFGLCEASVFECEVVGVSNVTGAVIEVTCEVFCPSTVEGAEWKADLEKWVYSIPYGTFVIDEAKRQADIIHRKIVAYSNVYNSTMYNQNDSLMAFWAGQIVNTSANFATTIEELMYSTYPKLLNEKSYNYVVKDLLHYDNYSGTVLQEGLTTRKYLRIYLYMANVSRNSYVTKVKKQEFVKNSDFDAEIAQFASDAAQYADITAEELLDIINGKLDSYHQNRKTDVVCRRNDYISSSENAQRTFYITEGEAVIYPGKHAYVEYPKMDIEIWAYASTVQPLYSATICQLKEGTAKAYIVPISELPQTSFNLKREKDSYVSRYYAPSGYSARKAYEQINVLSLVSAYFETKGLFVRFNRYDSVEYINVKQQFALLPENDLYPSSDLYPEGVTGGKLLPDDYQTCWYDDGYTKPYGAVIVNYKNTSNEDAKVILYLAGFTKDTPTYEYITYNVDSNAFLNLYLWTQTQIEDICNTIASNISGVTYMPVEFVGRGLPYVEAGDTFEILTGSNDSITTIVLRRTISGEMVLTDSYKSV